MGRRKNDGRKATGFHLTDMPYCSGLSSLMSCYVNDGVDVSRFFYLYLLPCLFPCTCWLCSGCLGLWLVFFMAEWIWRGKLRWHCLSCARVVLYNTGWCKTASFILDPLLISISFNASSIKIVSNWLNGQIHMSKIRNVKLIDVGSSFEINWFRSDICCNKYWCHLLHCFWKHILFLVIYLRLKESAKDLKTIYIFYIQVDTRVHMHKTVKLPVRVA